MVRSRLMSVICTANFRKKCPRPTGCKVGTENSKGGTSGEIVKREGRTTVPLPPGYRIKIKCRCAFRQWNTQQLGLLAVLRHG